jgi:hypothetical protein
MGIFSSFFGKRDSRSVRCAKCRTPMFILTGVSVRMDVLMKSRGCFRCRNCGRYICYNCSDSSKPCKCGAQDWAETAYLNFIPESIVDIGF